VQFVSLISVTLTLTLDSIAEHVRNTLRDSWFRCKFVRRLGQQPFTRIKPFLILEMLYQIWPSI